MTATATEALAKIIALRDDYNAALARRENGVSAGIKFHEAVFSLLYQKTIADFAEAAPPMSAEPVAWIFEGYTGEDEWEPVLADFRPAEASGIRGITPLFAHPDTKVDLTAERDGDVVLAMFEVWQQACHELVYRSRHVKMYEAICKRALELMAERRLPALSKDRPDETQA